MPSPEPFDLPGPILAAAASRLAAAEGEARAAIVDELLAAHPEHGQALRALSDALQDTDRLLARNFGPSTPCDPARIGAYRVQRRLGEGAFGVVYLCAQDAPIRRQVAVKVLRPGAGDRNTLLRFEAERQVLAGFDHPGIASVIDAGTLPDGRPYFTMEHVDGVPITEHCDRRRLPVDARLRLFHDLCDGVQHAHMRGIIHRDLKPANVLVAERDGKAVPRIIDFGIAKALHAADGRRDALATATGRVVGTPGYMSPEQAAGNAADVDTRTDVFALGVLLYELLAGDLPWPKGRAATDAEPPRPSTRVQSDPARTPTIASMRAMAPRTLVSKLRGDLDWIVLKALSPERERRYQSARALADDVERHLCHEPVEAGPPSNAYRFAKLVRRHRVPAAATALVLAALLAGLIVSLVFYHEAEARSVAVTKALSSATEARGVAEVGFDTALATVDTLLTRVADLRLADKPETEQVQKGLLADALAFYEKLLRTHAQDPRLRREMSRVRLRVAALHLDLGHREEAQKGAGEVTADLEAMLADAAQSTDVLDARVNLAKAYGLLALANQGSDDGSRRRCLERAVLEFERVEIAAPGRATIALAHALSCLGESLRESGKMADCVPVLRRALQFVTSAAAAKPDDRHLQIGALGNLCHLILTLPENSPPAKADEDFHRLTDACQAQLRAGDLDDRLLRQLVLCWNCLGSSRFQREKYHDAAQAIDSAITVQRRLADRHPALPAERLQLMSLLCQLSRARADLDDDAGADVAVRESIAVGQGLAAQFPAEASFRLRLADACNVFVVALLKRGRRCDLVEAKPSAQQAIAILRALPDSAFPDDKLHMLANTAGNLGHVLDACGDEATSTWEEIVALYREIIRRRPEISSHHDNFSRAAARLATRRLAAQDLEGAAAVLREVRADRAANASASASPASHRNYARVLRLEALIAARQGDAVAAAARADEMEAWLDDWRVRRLAADALFAAWQAASNAASPDIVMVEEYGQRADALYESTIWELRPEFAAKPSYPEDSQTVCAWGQAHVRRGQWLVGIGEHARAQPLLTEGLQSLRAVRAEIHANWWSDEIYAAGHVALAQCHLAARDAVAAAAVARALAHAESDDAEALFLAACLHGECARLCAEHASLSSVARERAVNDQVDAALAALHRAVERGLCDRRRLEQAAALALVRERPQFATILARVPAQ